MVTVGLLASEPLPLSYSLPAPLQCRPLQLPTTPALDSTESFCGSLSTLASKIYTHNLIIHGPCLAANGHQ
ncbi:hypothetical protein FRB93_009935 [Tulasnella sp. JGI-2019a]|nr:hypothetical protein FRB93_009935 [Tulasnella sp. JGI-2019a]